MTLDDLVFTLTARLKAAGIESARLDAKLLLRHVLGLTSEYLLAHGRQAVSDDDITRVEPWVQRREAREPIAHILGAKEFWSFDVQVGPEVLSPRPESEILVQAALDGLDQPSKPPRILDLGTGSGCLLLAVLSELPGAHGDGIDQSAGAIALARKNAAALDLAERSQFFQRSWADWQGGPYDLILANPPYIPSADIDTLEPEVRDFEPLSALDGGLDGLDCYRQIAGVIDRFLKPSGLAVFEFGMGQAAALQGVFCKDPFEVIDIKRDLAGIERVLTVRRTIR